MQYEQNEKINHNTNPLFQWQHGIFHPNTSPPIFKFGTRMFYPVTKCLLFCPTGPTLADNSETEEKINFKKTSSYVQKKKIQLCIQSRTR